MNNKKTILNLYELYSDNLYEITPEIEVIKNKEIDIIEEFILTLNQNNKIMFDKILDIHSQIENSINKNIFEKAFSLAICLIYEGVGIELDKEKYQKN